MRDVKFRAWAEHTIDNRWNYAWNKSEEVFSKTEPSKHSQEWSEWYDKKEDYRNELLMEWDSQFIVDRYVKEKAMITNIMVNGTVQRPHGYEIIDIMQFSGLKDQSNNKNEVYEGDIVEEIGWQGDYYVVEFIDCAFYAISLKRYVPAGIRTRYVKLDELMNIQVVGNKYENIELLEGDK